MYPSQEPSGGRACIHPFFTDVEAEVKSGYVTWGTRGEHWSQDLAQQFDSGVLDHHTSLKIFN